MKYRTLAGWQKACIATIWIFAIGATAGLILMTPPERTGGPLFIALTLAPFVLALLASLPLALNPRGPERAFASEQNLAEQNDAFSVVNGRVRTRSGEVRPVSVIVPTVFGAGGSLLEGVFTESAGSSIGSGSQHVAREETLDFALQAAREQYPDCEWDGEPLLREANEQECASALRDGINLKYV